MYAFWLWLHVICVWLSIAGFLLRGAWMMADSPLRRSRPARILPHVIDTLLLVAGVALSVTLGIYPFEQGWLTAKLLALILYIGLGVVAFRAGRTKGIRTAAFVAALVTFAYMLAVAYQRDPLPFG